MIVKATSWSKGWAPRCVHCMSFLSRCRSRSHYAGKPCGVDSPSGMQIQFVASRNRINAAGTESTMAWSTPSIYDHRSTTALQHSGLLAAQTSALAVHCPWISVSIRACRLGNPGDLLLKLAIGLAAPGPGTGICGVWYLGPMEVAQTAQVIGLCRTVSDRACMVDLHPPFTSSSVAAGSSGDAAGNHRRRPRTSMTGVRNFEYRTKDDFTVRYQERDVWLSSLIRSISLYPIWAPGPVGHTFLSFNFDNALPVCISIETRPEVGEGFDPSPHSSNNRADLRRRR